MHCFYVKNRYSDDAQKAEESFRRMADSTKGNTGELDIESPQGDEMLCGIVTTRILAVMDDGAAMVEAYNQQFGRHGHA